MLIKSCCLKVQFCILTISVKYTLLEYLAKDTLANPTAYFVLKSENLSLSCQYSDPGDLMA